MKGGGSCAREGCAGGNILYHDITTSPWPRRMLDGRHDQETDGRRDGASLSLMSRCGRHLPSSTCMAMMEERQKVASLKFLLSASGLSESPLVAGQGASVRPPRPTERSAAFVKYVVEP